MQKRTTSYFASVAMKWDKKFVFFKYIWYQLLEKELFLLYTK